MKVLVAGAFGYLGKDIVRKLEHKDIDIIACGKTIREIPGLTQKEKISFRKCDMTKEEEVEGICEDVDIVISTVGITSSEKELTHYDVDYNGNLRLLKDAVKCGVKKFIYISVIKSDDDSTIPMLHAKYLFEEELKKSGIDYTIYRPTGYFYDIVKVFKPMIDKGTVNLLKGKKVYTNVIDTPDFAEYIVNNLDKRSRNTIEIGGMETYSYEEIAEIFFNAANKKPEIKYVPSKLFDVLGFISKVRRTGKYADIMFGKWTLSNDMRAEVKYGHNSFKEYIKNIYDK